MHNTFLPIILSNLVTL